MPSREVDKSPEKIRRMFGSIAPRYDFLNRLLSLRLDVSWRRRCADRLLKATTVDGPILDVCTGTADLALALWKRQQTRKVFGVDFSPEMIDIGKKKTRSTDIELSVGDALNLPFDDESFAAVCVAFGLRNISDTDRGLAEMVRVCKPGGVVAVLEFSMPTLPILSGFYRFYFRTVLPRIGQCLAKNRDDAYTYLPESVLQFDNPQHLADRMRAAGLVDIEIRSLTFGTVTLLTGRRNRSVLCRPEVGSYQTPQESSKLTEPECPLSTE